MAKTPGLTSRGRGGKTPAVATPERKGPTTPDAPKRPFNPATFVNEVRAEARKITWTSRQETWITSVMVFIMVLMTAFFFVIVDTVLGHGMQALLKLAT